MINWNVSMEDQELSYQIAKRVVKFFPEAKIDMLTMQMDIIACHNNGNPLRLQELLDADDMDFFHDTLGIRRHLDRNTGKLKDLFVPRYSVSE